MVLFGVHRGQMPNESTDPASAPVVERVARGKVADSSQPGQPMRGKVWAPGVRHPVAGIVGFSRPDFATGPVWIWHNEWGNVVRIGHAHIAVTTEPLQVPPLMLDVLMLAHGTRFRLGARQLVQIGNVGCFGFIRQGLMTHSFRCAWARSGCSVADGAGRSDSCP